MTIAEPSSDSHLSRTRQQFVDALPTHFERLGLGAVALTKLQTSRLRALLRHAIDKSPFHRRRLGTIDPDRFNLADLALLPPMSKEEMMAAFDEVVTDPALRLHQLNDHLETLAEAPGVYRDRFVVLASGGSSGTRGVFVADIDEAAQHMAAVVRGGFAAMAATAGWPPPAPAPITIVAAPTSVHATRGLSSIFLPGRLGNVTYAPVTAPFDQIVDTVQRSQPLLLIGYPSVIAQLADAQRDGHLSISPMAISVTSEQLTDDHVARITTGLGIAPTNSYGTSEGLMGTAPPGSDTFDFASDNAYIEFVDTDDNPVGIDQHAHHILVTNLYNTTQPLIRYQIDDAMTQAAPAENHGHQRATLEGRNDEHLDIDGKLIHPLTIRSPLVAEPSVRDYQVRLAPGKTLEVDIVATTIHINLTHIEATIATALARAGATAVHVRAQIVEHIPRDPRTGKTRRFLDVTGAHPDRAAAGVRVAGSAGTRMTDAP